MKDPDLGADGEEEVDEAQVALAALEDLGGRRRIALAAVQGGPTEFYSGN